MNGIPAHDDYRDRMRRRGTRFTYAGTLLVLLGAVLFALIVPAEADNRAYAAAAPCPQGTRADTCRVTAEATVLRKEQDSGGKTTKYYLVLTDPGTRTEHRVRMPSDGSVHAAARPGGRVTVTYWKDEVREVRLGNLVAEAELSPVHDGRLPGAFGVALLSGGLGALWFAAWLRFRPETPGAPLSWKPPTGLLAGIMVACVNFPVLLMGRGIWSGLEFTAWSIPASLPLSALVCWWAVRKVRRAAARVTPAVPARRQVLRVLVHGDVPYSRPGYVHLVVGDGPPALSTDPEARLARLPLPDTLRAHRVREVLVGDPEFSPGSREYPVVVECTDTTHPVLILTGKRTAPLVLGALGG
ncbi:hypothetical protein ACFW9D_19655 [Streptomyces sp. NPDC059524]|uniref:hypothetical protein n=1 Tax=Streptomyces sp. NPDC059524 TaxID=3346856 RepID=UPI00367FC774